MRTHLLTLSLLTWLTAYIIQYSDWLDLNKSFLYRIAPGHCQYVTEDGGSEDLTDVGDGIIIMSSGYGAGIGKGVMKALDLNTSKVVTMEIRGAPDKKDFMSTPHGITTWKDDKGQVFIYVLTHPPSEDRIEVFKLKDNFVLKYKRTITDPKFTYMNDLVAVGKDKFYITKFFHYRDILWRTLEFLSQKAWGGIMYYDGRKARDAVSSGLHMPNGINVSPDGKMIYVSEFGNNKLLGYHKYESNGLNKAWERYVDTHVDNIEVDPDNGDLWIGCHPVGYRIYDLFNWFKHLAPSQVLRFKMEDNTVSSIEQIYADDGSELQGSTTAAFVGGKLIIGTVVKQTLVCDVNYLSS